MARTSIAAAKQELYALVIAGGLPTGLTVAYDHEPLPGDLQKPTAVTVFTVGMTPDDYVLGLRIYATAAADAKAAQDTLDVLIQTIDARINSGFGPSNFEIEYRDDLVAFVATNLFQVGREDPAAYA